MKTGIHPTFYEDALVICACGNTWHTGSTKKEIHTDVCSKCHPFYTGEQRIVDTAGQVERFMKRVSAKEQLSAPEEQAKPTKKERRARARQIRSGMFEEPAAEAVAEAPVEVKPVATPEPETHVAPETVSPQDAAAEAAQLAAPEGEPRRRSRPPRGEGQPRGASSGPGEQRQRPPRRPRAERPARPAAQPAAQPAAPQAAESEAAGANEPRAEQTVQPAAEQPAAAPEPSAQPPAAESNEPRAEQPAEAGEPPAEGTSGE